MKKHTPGPWSLERAGTPMASNRVWPTTGRTPICSLSSFGSSPADLDPEAQANGRLIAAAPALLKALQYARGFIADSVGPDAELVPIDAAIAEATGDA